MALLNRLKTVVFTFVLTALVTSCLPKDQGRQPSFKGIGKKSESRQVTSDDEFGWTYDQEGFSANNALDAQDAKGANYLNPGEGGIPAYDKFSAPMGELASIFQPVYFGTNDDIIRGKENFAKVSQTATYLKSHPDVLIFIEGHCDMRGAAAYNLSLGARRAGSVRNLLVEQGIEPSRIFTITFGKERPSREGDSEEAWRWNRRIEYKIFQK